MFSAVTQRTALATTTHKGIINVEGFVHMSCFSYAEIWWLVTGLDGGFHSNFRGFLQNSEIYRHYIRVSRLYIIKVL